MIAVALTALAAAPGPTGWQRVEGLKPGAAIRVVREFGAERGCGGAKAFVGTVALDAGLGYFISKDRSRFEVVYRR
jgi:hypothetical protein